MRGICKYKAHSTFLEREQKSNTFLTTHVYCFALKWGQVGKMSEIVCDFPVVVRLGEYCRELERLHLWGDDEEIDREFNSVCRAVWAYTCDDFDDDQLSADDHAFLDSLTKKTAY